LVAKGQPSNKLKLIIARTIALNLPERSKLSRRGRVPLISDNISGRNQSHSCSQSPVAVYKSKKERDNHVLGVSQEDKQALRGRLRACDLRYRVGKQAASLPSAENQATDVHAEVTIHANGLRVRSLNCDKKMPVGGQRGPITDFTAGARRRLRQETLDYDLDYYTAPAKGASSGRALFTTLTYPLQYSDDWEGWKADKRAFERRLQRRYPDLHGELWRLELQKRGAPHFHLLVFFENEVKRASFLRWARQAWYEIVGSGDLKHLRHGVDVRVMYGRGWRVMRYLLKYMTKPLGRGAKQEHEDGTAVSPAIGRTWGHWGAIRKVPTTRLALTGPAAVEFARRMRRYFKQSGPGRWAQRMRRTHCNSSYTILGVGGDLLQLLRGLPSLWFEIAGEPCLEWCSN
jgi:hypothetical protein